jgi:hypothetical protein
VTIANAGQSAHEQRDEARAQDQIVTLIAPPSRAAASSRPVSAIICSVETLT